jgi:hypothetical protein
MAEVHRYERCLRIGRFFFGVKVARAEKKIDHAVLVEKERTEAK